MALAAQPHRGDVVIQAENAVVFLEQSVAPRLSDQLLDARSNDSGSAFFFA